MALLGSEEAEQGIGRMRGRNGGIVGKKAHSGEVMDVLPNPNGFSRWYHHP